MNAAIILASGSGRRMETDVPKAFLMLAGKPVAYYSVKTASEADDVELVILTVPPGWKKKISDESSKWGMPRLEIVEGGATRQESVLNALHELPMDTKMVVIHDAARPLASRKLFKIVMDGAREHGACIPAVSSGDSVKIVRGGIVAETLNRDEVHLVQTPQAFYFEALLKAHDHARDRKWRVTDDSALIERMGRPVAVVPGESGNMKITYPGDLETAEFMMKMKR